MSERREERRDQKIVTGRPGGGKQMKPSTSLKKRRKRERNVRRKASSMVFERFTRQMMGRRRKTWEYGVSLISNSRAISHPSLKPANPPQHFSTRTYPFSPDSYIFPRSTRHLQKSGSDQFFSRTRAKQKPFAHRFILPALWISPSKSPGL